MFALLEGDRDQGYGTYGERARDLAIRGVRLVIEEFRTDVTKTKKDGSRGALRIDYGNPSDTAATRAWLWKYLAAAQSAGELYGRALVLIAAEKYALRLVVPASQQRPPIRWSSRKDQAEKALVKLVGPHLPASYKQLERAIAEAKSDRDKQLAALRQAPPAAAAGDSERDHEADSDSERDHEADSDSERDHEADSDSEDLDVEDLAEDDEL